MSRSLERQLLILRDWNASYLKMGPIGCPETSVITILYRVTFQKSGDLKYVWSHTSNAPIHCQRYTGTRSHMEDSVITKLCH
jgi:hypothetical protein